jgi:hypothetical protein
MPLFDIYETVKKDNGVVAFHLAVVLFLSV